ncbi:MAG TPA: alkaline phosphatase family protein, partial [Pyrinomonadaceae bacterium]|nr:alkaline phosphatase family protein [Pyrinomonadaceae bacterium]
FIRERDPRTGKSVLPWFEHVFYERGTRLVNFYTRGISLSGPGWSLLDTGQHAQIKGNVEYDRFTLHSYDYLNFIPFYLGNAFGERMDMPGVVVLDEIGIPLLLDAFAYDERHQSFQLYQRGLRWTTLERGLKNRFSSRTPRELVDEWTLGLETRTIVLEQLERELLEKLNNPRIKYLDYYATEVDHAAHHNRDSQTHLAALRDLDGILGRIWMGIQKSPLADETLFILVSDHGVNTDDRVYSQGYNLVKLLGSREGGGHHVVTKRRLLLDYSIKGINPLVPLITTTTPDSYYLKGQSTDYPTALVDFDGNERAAIHLRHSTLNVLHLLWQQLRRRDLAPAVRRAATNTFFAVIDGSRRAWSATHAELSEELEALRRIMEKQRAVIEAQPKEWTRADRDAGRAQAARRVVYHQQLMAEDEKEYGAYARTLGALLALRPETFDPSRLKIEDHLAKGAMGEANTIHQLQNYVVGIGGPGGELVLSAEGSAIDLGRSLARVDYFALLCGVAVRNNVQAGVGARPVDFIAVRVEREHIAEQLGRDLRADEIFWLHRDADNQALVLARNEGAEGRPLLRYLPVARLRQELNGAVFFDRAAWRAELPLMLWEDERAEIPGERRAWLEEWHTDREWLRAFYRAAYSNGVVGVHELLARHPLAALDLRAPNLTEDERLLRRFRQRQRLIVEPDLQVFANDHWNFDVRGFNPGGNHGSFLRASTHATLMLAGGARTGIPHGLVVEEPYDSLDFVPTVRALLGGNLSAAWENNLPPLSGLVIKEIFAQTGKGIVE